MATDEDAALLLSAKLPLEEQVLEKSWKARKQAYEQMLTALGEELDSDTQQRYAALLPKIVSDSNQGAQDVACDAALAFLDKCDSASVSSCASRVASSLVAKAFTSRPAIVKKANEIVLLLVEHGCASEAVEALAGAFQHKIPKLALAALDATFLAVQQFGTKVVPAKEVMAPLAKVFDAKDAKARDKAKEIVLELAKWVGKAPIQQTIMGKMRDTQKAEVEGWLTDLAPGKPTPSRLTKQAQAVQAAAAKLAAEEGQGQPPPDTAAGVGAAGVPGPTAAAPARAAAAPADSGDDDAAYDLVDPVDVVAKLPKSFWTDVADAKWSVRRDALSALLTVAATPKAASPNWHDLAGALKKVITKDTNAACVAEAAACVAALARSVRKPWAQFARSTFLAGCLDKLKDKSTAVSTQSASAARNMFKYCGLHLPDIEDTVKAQLAAKAPKGRELTLVWLAECVAAEEPALVAKAHGVLVPAVVALTADAVPETRNAAFVALAAFVTRAGGIKSLEKHLSKLDDKRKASVMDIVNGGRPKTPDAAQPASRPNSAPAKKPAAASRTAAAPAPAAAAATAAAAKPTIEDEVSLRSGSLSKDEARAELQAMLGEEVTAQLEDPVWKTRLLGMDSVLEALPSLNLAQSSSKLAQSIVQIPGWKDTNFQVLNKMCQVYAHLAANAPTFSKRDAFAGVIGMAEKLTDTKIRTHASEALSTMAEVVSLQFICTQVHSLAVPHKNPKVLSESLLYTSSALQQFGVPSVPPKLLLEWAKAGLASTNAPVRTSATALVGTLHQKLGDAIFAPLATDLKPSLLASVKDYCQKNGDAPEAPTRTERRPAASARAPGPAAAGRPAASRAAQPAGAAEDSDEGDDDLDSLMPREDISPKITDALIAQLTSSNWKERKAGMEATELILTSAGGRIEPSVGDLISGLKGRMSDTNRNLAAASVVLCTHLIAAMGAPFERVGRPLVAPILAILPDNKPVVRSAISDFVATYARTCNFEPLREPLVSAFAVPKCAGGGKACALDGLREALANRKKLSKADCQAVAVVAAIGLEDRAIEARTAAAGCVHALAAICPTAHIMNHGYDITPSQKQVLADAMAKAPTTLAAAPPGAHAAPPLPRATARPATAVPASQRAPAASARPASANATRAPASSTMSRTKGASSAASEADDADLIGYGAQSKDDRRVPLRSARFELRVGEEDTVRAAMLDAVAPRLHKLMFAKDFKLHCQACDLLKGCIPTHLDQMTACLDLLLRWAVLRFCDEKLQSVLKVQAFLSQLLLALADVQYSASDNEAGLVLPCLCDKVGHNQDRCRSGYKDLLSQFRVVTNPHRMAVYVMEGLEGKNMKSRADNCDEMGEAIRAYGIDTLYRGPRSKRTCNALKLIAAQTSERDGALRKAALGALMVVYELEGPAQFWNLLGDKLSQQQQDLISERQKYMDKELAKKGIEPGWQAAERSLEAEPAPAARAATPPQQVQAERPFTPEKSFQPPPRLAASAAYAQVPPLGAAEPHAGLNNGRGNSYAAPERSVPNPAQTPMPGPPLADSRGAVLPSPALPPASSTDNTVRWKRAMASFSENPGQEQIEDIKVIFYVLVEYSKDNLDWTTKNVILRSLDQLVMDLTDRSPSIFENAIYMSRSGTSVNPARGIRYLINCLIQVFSQRTTAREVSAEAMTPLIAELLSKLSHHSAMLGMKEGPELLRVLNVLMCKVLEHGNKNSLYCALFQVVILCPADVRAQGEQCVLRYKDLIVKCLVKLTRPMNTYINEDFSVEQLLLAMHEYFETLGVDEIRRMSRTEDKPLRMVKTALHELCKIVGTDILDSCHVLPKVNGVGAKPILLAYIDVNLKTLKDVGMLKGDKPYNESGSAAPAGAPAAAPAAAPAMTSPPAGARRDASSSDSAASPLMRNAPPPPMPTAAPLTPTPGAAQIAPPSRPVQVAHAAGEREVDNNENGAVLAPGALIAGDGMPRQVLQNSNESNTPEAISTGVPEHLKPVIHETFKKIGVQSTTMEGLDQLYTLWEQHPNLPVEKLISTTSTAFQGYISKGLEKIKRRREAASRKQAAQGGSAPAVPASVPTAAPVEVARPAYEPSVQRQGSASDDLEQLRERLRRMEAQQQQGRQ